MEIRLIKSLWGMEGSTYQEARVGYAQGPQVPHPGAPFTNEPVSDLWETCRWMADRLRETYRE
ncbi:hypothetical protein [Paenibacillus qinlingensis]|uniref:hypothetical protein n=1 Tax=Paenibacillus qinlingensis TaxID=1837343 RepID=UPI0015643239|nr:hypothetical protein [Paenibacillus qinlingensis]NQX63346.1 hypothetical protein [Paenibacillus qinlingensis]